MPGLTTSMHDPRFGVRRQPTASIRGSRAAASRVLWRRGGHHGQQQAMDSGDVGPHPQLTFYRTRRGSVPRWGVDPIRGSADKAAKDPWSAPGTVGCTAVTVRRGPPPAGSVLASATRRSHTVAQSQELAYAAGMMVGGSAGSKVMGVQRGGPVPRDAMPAKTRLLVIVAGSLAMVGLAVTVIDHASMPATFGVALFGAAGWVLVFIMVRHVRGSPPRTLQRYLQGFRRVAGALLLVVGCRFLLAIAYRTGPLRSDAIAVIVGVPVPVASSLIELLVPLGLIAAGGVLLLGKPDADQPVAGRHRANGPSNPPAPTRQRKPEHPARRTTGVPAHGQSATTPNPGRHPAPQDVRSAATVHQRRADGYCAHCFQPWPCSWSDERPRP